MVKSYRDLQVWQKAMRLTETVYEATEGFPRREIFGLTVQIRKSAVSIPSNIAEGQAIGGRSYLRHLRIAIGSEAELQTQVEVALGLRFLDRETASALLDDAAEIGRMLNGLLKAVAAQQARQRIAGISGLLLIFWLSSTVLS